MSLSKRVAEAIDKMNSDDPEGALFQICSALEATATAFYQKKGKGSYKDFIHENMDLITRIALGRRILNLHLVYDLNQHLDADEPRITPNPDGSFSIEQIFYHAVRCSLYHKTTLPPGLVFGKEQIIAVKDGELILPASLVSGLIYTVVTCPINARERIEDHYGVNIGGWAVPVNSLWGKQAELRNLLETMDSILN